MACAAAIIVADIAPIPVRAQPAQQTDTGTATRALSHPKKNASNAAEPKLSAPVTELAKPWSLDDALPTNSPAAQSQATKPATRRASSKSESEKPSLGRLPLSNGAGSFGIETETKVKSTAFPDGRPTPGVESTPHRPPSYFGLSISVPTEK